jgi:hypothetical protein
MTTPKRTDPLTTQEVAEASIIFFDLFQVVLNYAPEGTTVEDGIKLTETVFAYAHKRRATALEEDSVGPFGFNKKEEV